MKDAEREEDRRRRRGRLGGRRDGHQPAKSVGSGAGHRLAKLVGSGGSQWKWPNPKENPMKHGICSAEDWRDLVPFEGESNGGGGGSWPATVDSGNSKATKLN